MVKVQVFNTTEGFRCLTDSNGGGSKIAVPPLEGNRSPRVEVTTKQFADCWKELLKLTKRGTLVLEATDGITTQVIPFEFAAKHFGFRRKGEGWEPIPAPEPKTLEPFSNAPTPVAPLMPPPGFTPLDNTLDEMTASLQAKVDQG